VVRDEVVRAEEVISLLMMAASQLAPRRLMMEEYYWLCLMDRMSSRDPDLLLTRFDLVSDWVEKTLARSSITDTHSA